MKRGEKEAIKAVRDALSERTEPITLFSMSNIADRAARKRRETDLYDSLHDYEHLIPDGWSCRWLGSEHSSDRMLYVVPRNWQPGDSDSNSLLMPGKLTC